MKFLKLIQNLLFAFVAADCSDPASDLSARNQVYKLGPSPPTDFSEGVEHSIECQVGYRWLDGSSLNAITCLSTVQWSIIAACFCMLVYLYN